jgi:hypothetical protein
MDTHGYLVPGRGWVWEDFCTCGRVRIRGWGRVYVHGYGSGELIPAGEFSIDISTLLDAVFSRKATVRLRACVILGGR